VNRNARVLTGILDRIVHTKRAEVERLRPALADLRARATDAPAPRDFAGALRDAASVALIAEYKRRSPSAGPIASGEVVEVAREYAAAGAQAMSVLTDAEYFGGRLEDLTEARAAAGLPVLRKDFVIDGAQLIEARAAGADAVLLIVRILDDHALRDLLACTADLGMAALVEAHDADEVERALAAGAEVIGINNRDLSTFVTDLGVSIGLAEAVPADRVLVAESGIASPADVDRLGAAGVDAVLVGETVMRSRGMAAALTGRARRPRGQADR
jgi:indole-3-glycerol phosphate synthase